MDGVLMLWDLTTGELVRSSGGHGVMMDLAMDPRGDSILAGSADMTIFRWSLSNPSPDALQTWIRANRYVRNPTCKEQKLYQIAAPPGGLCS